MQRLINAWATTLGLQASVEQHDTNGILEKFMEHMAKFHLSFATKEEFEYRFQIFKNTDKEINEVNGNSNNTFTVNHNRFSTWSADERKKLMGKKPDMRNEKEEKSYKPVSKNNLTEDPIDWRTKGAVNPIQNQGSCGSCWAFSSAAALEGKYFLKYGNLPKFAEQQWVDCDDICYGCNGGLEVFAFRYAQEFKIEESKDYPYTGKADQACAYDADKGIANTKTWGELYPGIESELIEQLAIGPTCVSVYAANNYFLLYDKGILNTQDCVGRLDHAVTAVGWGVEGDQKYLIVRNSWGTDWGEEGYIRMALDGDGRGVCGVLLDSTFVNVA